MITDLAEGAPATKGWGERKRALTFLWREMTIYYSKNPTPPSVAQNLGRRDCVYVTLMLHRTLEIGYATLTLYFK